MKVQDPRLQARTNICHGLQLALAVYRHSHLRLEIADILYEVPYSGRTFTITTSPNQTLSLTKALGVHKAGRSRWQKQSMGGKAAMLT